MLNLGTTVAGAGAGLLYEMGEGGETLTQYGFSGHSRSWLVGLRQL